MGKCIHGSKIVVRIANEKRISTNKTFSPSCASIGQKKITDLNFTDLPHLKCVDFIFGLPTLKVLNMSIQPSNNSVLIGDMNFACESQPRRVSYFLVDSTKMQKILAKAIRNKHRETELLLVSLHFSEELESIKQTLVLNWIHNLNSLSLNFLIILGNRKGYHLTEEYLIIKFVSPLTLSVGDVIVFLFLSTRTLRDNVHISSNRD